MRGEKMGMVSMAWKSLRRKLFGLTFQEILPEVMGSLNSEPLVYASITPSRYSTSHYDLGNSKLAVSYSLQDNRYSFEENIRVKIRREPKYTLSVTYQNGQYSAWSYNGTYYLNKTNPPERNIELEELRQHVLSSLQNALTS